jgi:aminopeptidase YwaD
MLIRFVIFLFLASSAFAQSYVAKERTIRGDMEFLASDALQGRGSTTQYELIAATYIASQLRQIGVEPAGDSGTYIQTISIPAHQVAAPPVLRAGDQQWTHGKDLAVASLGSAKISGPLQKLTPGATVQKGAIVFVALRQDKDAPPVRDQIFLPLRGGAALVIVGAATQIQQRYESALKQMPTFEQDGRNFVILGPDATTAISALADGTAIELTADVKELAPRHTWNVLGKLPGSSPEIILLSAHLDALGVRGTGKDNIVNGADDNASGVAAVLELARALAAQPKRRRTVYFALFGSEEIGLVGSEKFLEKPPFALDSIAANLEFEMIGRPDPKVAAKTLWITGYDRSNLGSTLAKQGAKLVADPYPQQSFFERSDNYSLAKKGVVAHTISSFGFHPKYHQPDDDLSNIDFAHMRSAIQSLVKPVLWLVNSRFKPHWNPGKKP